MIQLKVCGMRDERNIIDVAALQPDYIGFIFYPTSKRFVGDDFVMPQINPKIKKVGVFVNTGLYDLLAKVKKYDLDFVQLHGSESVDYCKIVKRSGVGVIKAFGVDSNFDLYALDDYQDVCDLFLFDTKSDAHGGTGKHFDWSVLKNYDLNVPVILSGGISLFDIKAVEELNKTITVFAVDINSKFEIEPGLKNVHEIEKFIKLLNVVP